MCHCSEHGGVMEYIIIVITWLMVHMLNENLVDGETCLIEGKSNLFVLIPTLRVQFIVILE